MSDKTTRERISNVGAGVTPTYHATESVEEAKAVVEQCMSATDELRRMLDESGVEYRWDNGVATWYVDGVMYNAWAYDNERLTMSVCHLTPEQAIEATLGRGECHAEQDWDNDETPQARWWRCDACGAKFVHLRGLNPSYCPECGRKVVGE